MNDLVELRRDRDERTADPRRREALRRDLEGVIRGEVRFGRGDRALWATDASNYRQPPIGVVLPKDADDVVAAMEVCRAHDAPVLSRGGGTSLAGQCCNHAVVLDCSKYMRGVTDVDAENRRASVLPGTVLDRLNERLGEHGLVFGPDPSTHDRCTIGGMLGNNACGVHAIQAELYGPGPRTEDHVHELDVLTWDGVRMRVGATSDAEYERIQREGGRKAEIYRDLRVLRDRYADRIRGGFPDIPRRVSGYALPELLPENGFHVGRALVGSEATLVTVLEATFELGPAFPARALLLLGYEDVYAAADDVPRVREQRPIGLEGIDRLLTQFIREKGMHPEYLEDLPEGDGWLLVELGGQTAEEAAERAHGACEALTRGRGRPAGVVVTDPERQARMWQIRKSGLGATAFVPGRPDTWPGWEDAAVPVDRVGTYLRELRDLFHRYDYEVSVYGHFGQGCIHCRIPFDLRSEEGVEEYRRFTLEAAELVVAHGGALSGEHGDGQARGDLLPVMYGEELVDAMREMKRIFDPQNRMNPGKVIDADPRTANLRLGPDYDPWEPETTFAFGGEDQGRFSRAALRCVGVGECRRTEGGTMCPSYQVTLEEKHSTRGRARMLFELTRGDVLDEGWKSEEVFDALDLCLSCKGCKEDCPVSVDMAQYKAEFLSHYYEGRLRPRHAYAFGLIDRWARIGSAIPGLANWATHAPGLGTLAKKTGGIATERDVPRFAETTFRRWYARRGRKTRRAEGTPKRRVLLWPDTFNDHFFPRTLAAAVEVLEHAGVDVDVPTTHLCCGRPLYDYGMLDRAKRYWAKILDALESEIRGGTLVVGVEPSCVAAFRDELVELFGDDGRARALAAQTLTLGEYLEGLEGWSPPRLDGVRALFHGHCHHDAVMGTDPEKRLLRRMGLELSTPATGCCGMAGSFGFEAEHYEVSVAAGERVLLPRVRDADDAVLVVADGFSCREQIEQHTEREALHLAEVIQLAIAREGTLDDAGKPEAEVRAMEPAELRAAGSPHAKAAAFVGLVALGSAAWYWLAPLLGI
ncbi:MAG TPA: FAD-binding and (Fe-S)-binding domain-containing protein [Sandaracinaceae bacterium LLY-WYZ-13_1]|nr:FAD-binding and (Fe-S)-binding domain-containing protein [Sandaracinaceae bacterium LLY-WYZ-13_1]